MARQPKRKHRTMMRSGPEFQPTPPTTTSKRSLSRRIMSRALRETKHLFGLCSNLRGEDRRVLERVVFPYFLDSAAYRFVLWVGCEWYTRGYNRLFEFRKDYWTLDIDPGSRRHGARRHIVDGLQNLQHHFVPGALDLVLCNGVFGWGLDSRSEVDCALGACHACLRESGVLMIGWDDIPERRPFPLSECVALRAYVPFVFPPLGTAEFLTDTPYRHTYSFFAKPGGSTSSARGPG
jgi:SAM-dependent methyltransferase